MFAREKRIGPYTYVYLVENVREAGRTKQHIIANLGRKEVADARGDLDRLTRSLARLAQRSLLLSALDGEVPPGVACQRIGQRCCSSGCGNRPAAAMSSTNWPCRASSGLLPSAPYF